MKDYTPYLMNLKKYLSYEDRLFLDFLPKKKFIEISNNLWVFRATLKERSSVYKENLSITEVNKIFRDKSLELLIEDLAKDKEKPFNHEIIRKVNIIIDRKKKIKIINNGGKRD